MALFSRRRPVGSFGAEPVLQASGKELAALGYAAYGGDSPHPPGPRWTDYDQYATHALEVTGYPAHGTPAYDQMTDRLLHEAAERASEAPPWGVVGAMLVAKNCITNLDHPLFLQLLDEASLVLRNDGVAYATLPRFALERWETAHGRGKGLGPKGWPSALAYRSVPEPGAEPQVKDLADGERRRMIVDAPGNQGRMTYAQRDDDGRIVAIIEGVDLGDGEYKSWPLGIEADSYVDFLRALGDRLSTPHHWNHEDLSPYFPCVDRSRDEMRQLAREAELN